MISIGCLIYRSIEHAKFVYRSILQTTPMLLSGEAEFYFIANLPDPKLLYNLHALNYPFKVHMPRPWSQAQLRTRGISKPTYMSDVYSGCNRVFSEASGDHCCLISSDMAFSPGWLEALVAEQNGNRIVTSQLVEPTLYSDGNFGGAYAKDFGDNIDTFDAAAFLHYASLVAERGTRPGGQFVPMLVPMRLWHLNGGYPEGNILQENAEYGLAGDMAMHHRWAALGVEHVTALSSVVYHFCQGEMRS